MPREKVTAEERIEAAKACIEGKISQTEAARRLGVDESTVENWVHRYTYGGSLSFQKQEHNNVYSPELKMSAVKEYLSGVGALERIAAKYGLRSKTQLRKWIIVYNSGRDFEHKTSGGSRMKQGRETTQEERIAIVKDCLENGSNYRETAVKHDVSYNQVYTWMKKFSELGEAGLEDRRGKRMATQEPRSELEMLKIKMAQLEHENYMLRMERNLLKKVEDLERRDGV
ncbi:MAG: helix-turn-helix domain-containing protein [Clostridiales bacterium]|nr:helix-turn-helix domain-containing protein [Clostridiales bacterium]